MSSKTKEKSFEPFRTIIIAGALALMFRSLLFEPFNIPSGSMIPTSRSATICSFPSFPTDIRAIPSRSASFPLTVGYAGEPERGDVVVFRQPAMKMSPSSSGSSACR